jgi:predicted nucleotidyltransferase
MGGSGGGGGYYRPISEAISAKVEQARQEESVRLAGAVNEHLKEVLAQFNSRDAELANKRLDSIADHLGEHVDVEQILLGGSVAKRTDVEGLSDLDGLLVLDKARHSADSPRSLKDEVFTHLDAAIPRGQVVDVKVGHMAVTVRYKDGMEVQLIPALKDGKTVYIGSPSGKSWVSIEPHKFRNALTAANERLGKALVPAIKLMKALNATLPEQKRLSGYHIESLAVDAAKQYKGPNTYRDVLVHLCGHAATRVLQPIADVTGQSRNADDRLGPADSVGRRNAAQAMAGLRRRLEAATSVGEWKALLGE